MFWNPRIETMPYEELKQLQYHELKQLVNNLYSFNKFYHDRMREALSLIHISEPTRL